MPRTKKVSTYDPNAEASAEDRRFRCIKNKLFFDGRTWKEGEIFIDSDEPRDGKGNSLLTGKSPAFVEIQ